MVAIRQETSVKKVGRVRNKKKGTTGSTQLNLFTHSKTLKKWHAQSQTIFPGVGVGVGGRVIFKFARGSDS